MTAGTASWSDISSIANNLMQDSMAVARMANLLIPTVTGFSGSGMNLRKQYQWNSVAFAEHTEETDEASTAFTKSLLATLTPKNYHARVDITDEMVASDWDNTRASAAMELGSGAAKHVDKNIATLFSTAIWTGGTIGVADAGTAANGTITWRAITKALALLQDKDIPAGAPIFCALHPYQWEVLLSANTVAASTVAVAPGFQDRMTSSGGFFQIPQFVGVTFVITNSISIANTAAYGLMYTPRAIALDTRKTFSIEPQRDASKQAWEFNASMWYAFGALDPTNGVLLRHQAATPS